MNLPQKKSNNPLAKVEKRYFIAGGIAIASWFFFGLGGFLPFVAGFAAAMILDRVR